MRRGVLSPGSGADRRGGWRGMRGEKLLGMSCTTEVEGGVNNDWII